MATTFSTTINAMYTVQQPDPNYVVNVLFTVTGVSGKNTASIDGNVQFSSDQAPENFIPYEDLTEDDVLDWTHLVNFQIYKRVYKGKLTAW
jgi:hypothetical protein